MLNFESFVDLPLIWYGLIATAVFLYILLDGFDPGSHDEFDRSLLGWQ
jgi:cytochrome d ubiquinol oxidase subunit II